MFFINWLNILCFQKCNATTLQAHIFSKEAFGFELSYSSLVHDLKLVCPSVGNRGCCLMAYTGIRADSLAADLCIRRNTSQEKRNFRVMSFRTILEVFWYAALVFEKKNCGSLLICIAVFPVIRLSHSGWGRGGRRGKLWNIPLE